MTNLIAYSQPSKESLKIEAEKIGMVLIDRVRYQNFLIKSNRVADKLQFKIKELNIALSDLTIADDLAIDYKRTIEGMQIQIDKMKEYAKYLKKRTKKAWFNGIWQGGTGMLGIILMLLLL